MIATSQYSILIILQIRPVLTSADIQLFKEVYIWLHQQLNQIRSVEVMVKLFVSDGVASSFYSCNDKPFLRFIAFTDEIWKTEAADAFNFGAKDLLVVNVWVSLFVC